MKVSKLLNFLGDSGYESKAIRYIYVYLIALGVLVWQLLSSSCNSVDTGSYYTAADGLLNGKWDVFRTPVYPAILAIGKVLFGVYGCYFTLSLQICCFFLSAVILQRLCVNLSQSSRATFWVVSIYLLMTSLSSVPMRILTDSLGMSLTIFMLWYLLRKYPALPSIADLCLATVILTVLIFLRPFFIYLLPILAIYYVCALLTYRRRFKRGFLTGVIGLSFVLLCYQGYKTTIFNNYGIKSVSIVSSVNNYFLVRAATTPDTTLTENTQMKKHLSRYHNYAPEIVNVYDEIYELRACSSDAEFESYVNQQIANNKSAVIKAIILRAYKEALSYEYIPLGMSHSVWIHRLAMHMPSIFAYFLFIFIYAIGWLIVWRHNRRLPLPSLLLLMISAGATCASIIGAQAEWARLSLPGFPALLIMIAIALSTMSVSLKKYYTR